jgi:hypothetical protein
MRATYALILATACASPSAPQLLANVQPRLPPATVTCFAGMFTEHDGERVHIVMRRTVDPSAATIHQEAVRTSGGLGFVMAGEVTLSVTGATFRSKTPEHAHGDGRFDGPAWAWTHWTETRRHDSWTEDIEGWLEDGHLRFRGRIVEKATTWSAELDVLDCAEYEPRIKSWETHAEEVAP